jgi:hypothetical protein
MTPVEVASPLAHRNPSHVWLWTPPRKAMQPNDLPPPPSSVTPPRVSARTTTGVVRDANRPSIQSESSA